MTKNLMVCLGNICRSPLAEGILRQKIKDHNADGIVDSAGTSDYHIGQSPDPRTIENAKKHGVDLTTLRGRQFSALDFDEFDQIYVMDQSNYQNVMQIARHKADEAKIELILNVVNPGANHAVPDPYYGGSEGFENVFRLLDEACEIIASKLPKKTQ